MSKIHDIYTKKKNRPLPSLKMGGLFPDYLVNVGVKLPLSQDKR